MEKQSRVSNEFISLFNQGNGLAGRLGLGPIWPGLGPIWPGRGPIWPGLQPNWLGLRPNQARHRAILARPSFSNF